MIYFSRKRSPSLSHTENFLYMMRNEKPNAVDARTMDVATILHMDQEMNASSFTCLVVASTLSDIYSDCRNLNIKSDTEVLTLRL
ncbi:citrate/2-methylcitrate synthase [Acidianus sp. HS-5]|uniref:citrate/2-methylcitrate synthase n=1 Tax=Acidianus sp. HS-5 TaxID=2886040 RepID=UPI001F464E25|nr:citrate/2-methylcitrate synthase [Acidianus sp. HS-5]